MNNLIAVIVLFVIVIIWFQYRAENLEVITSKKLPRQLADKYPDVVTIDAIPMTVPAPQIAPDDPPIAAVETSGAAPISLSFDAAIARNALARSRDKRVFDAIANRTLDYWRPFFQEEIEQCEKRDWWDDIAYPMNDSGEIYLTPQTDST